MTITVANLPYSFCPAASAQSNLGFMYKNAYVIIRAITHIQ